MNKLERKELAKIKLEARRKRISRVRSRVAILALMLGVLFTGASMAQGFLGKPDVQEQVILAQKPPVVSYEEDDDDDEAFVAQKTADPSQTWKSSTEAPIVSSQS
jgi:hypothetical protein